MDDLTYVKRADRKLYCFVEICGVLFPSTAKSTVRNWVRHLQIRLLPAEVEERSSFKEKNASLGALFSLIGEEDVARLREHGSRKRCKLDVSSDNSIPTSPGNASSFPGDIGQTSRDIAVLSDSSDDEDSTQALEIKQLFATGKSRHAYQLTLNEAPDTLCMEIKKLREFYLRDLNPMRRGGKFSLATVDKMVERAMCYMHYCKFAKNMSELALSLFNDVQLYSCYIEYLKDIRKLAPSTIIAHLIICVNIVKYNYAVDKPNVDPNSAIELQQYHAFQRQLQKECTIIAQCKREGLCASKQAKQFYFAQVLDTLRNLRDKYNESNGLKKMRHLHDFVLLALYLRAMPGRSKEIRTMQLYDKTEKGAPLDYSSLRSGNFIIFDAEGSAHIVQFDFKTSKSLGPTRIELSEDKDLMYYLKLYLQARQHLLLGKTHDFFFCNSNGDSFQSSSNLAKYLSAIFEREVSVRASTNALRHAIVTYFSSLDEAKNCELRKSLALLMKHSVRYQETVYNDQSYHEKTQIGRDFMRNELAASVFGKPDEIVSPCKNSSETADEEEYELRPNVGDVVALLDPVSTKENINIFIAKVARYTRDKSQAHLMHLERVKDASNLYKLKPGKAWIESRDALVYPIDIVYNSSSQYYELRSSPEDIYKAVRGDR